MRHYNGGMPILLALLLLVAPVASAQAPPTEQHVLFIGNSLTYSNDLPGLVARLARAKGVRVTCASVAFPNYSLEDHWQRGDALREIRKGGWSLVVLQQGPSAAPESQVLLREYVKRFDKEIRAAGARTSLYMVWPSRARPQDFDGVIRSYTAAAKDVKAKLFPVGDAWRVVWSRDASLELYSPDGLHPSALGAYVAALVIVKTAFGISPQGLPAPGIDAATARIVQDAVARLPT
jgi:lambda repressor-like predicted transcriptional regulator